MREPQAICLWLFSYLQHKFKVRAFNVTVHGASLRKPLGAMVSSTDQTPQVPVTLFLIICYFERPASSVRLVKTIHLRALLQILAIREP